MVIRCLPRFAPSRSKEPKRTYRAFGDHLLTLVIGSCPSVASMSLIIPFARILHSVALPCVRHTAAPATDMHRQSGPTASERSRLPFRPMQEDAASLYEAYTAAALKARSSNACLCMNP